MNKPITALVCILLVGLIAMCLAPLAHAQDPTPLPMVFIDDVETREDYGVVEFTISLSFMVDHEVEVTISTADGTATENDDYVPIVEGSVFFPPGEVFQTIAISILDDTSAELREFFTLRIGAQGAVVRDPYGVAVIFDDDVKAK